MSANSSRIPSGLPMILKVDDDKRVYRYLCVKLPTSRLELSRFAADAFACC